MSVTIDCGEGKHSVCSGWGTSHYLIPQHNDVEEFECACPCHSLKDRVREASDALKKGDDAVVAYLLGEQRLHPETRGGRNYHDESWGG